MSCSTSSCPTTTSTPSAGLLAQLLGRVPLPGSEATIDGLHLLGESGLDRRGRPRVQTLLVRRLTRDELGLAPIEDPPRRENGKSDNGRQSREGSREGRKVEADKAETKAEKAKADKRQVRPSGRQRVRARRSSPRRAVEADKARPKRPRPTRLPPTRSRRTRPRPRPEGGRKPLRAAEASRRGSRAGAAADDDAADRPSRRCARPSPTCRSTGARSTNVRRDDRRQQADRASQTPERIAEERNRQMTTPDNSTAETMTQTDRRRHHRRSTPRTPSW